MLIVIHELKLEPKASTIFPVSLRALMLKPETSLRVKQHHGELIQPYISREKKTEILKKTTSTKY